MLKTKWVIRQSSVWPGFKENIALWRGDTEQFVLQNGMARGDVTTYWQGN